TGLRGAKLRLEAQPASATGALRRKDAALALRDAATDFALPRGSGGFARCYVSDKTIDPATAFLRMPLLFDHAAGPVDFTLDIAAPRLVEGLDLGQDAVVPLPEFSGRARRFEPGAPDPAGLAPHLVGLAAGEMRDIALRLPDDLEDRALAGRQAGFGIRVLAVLRRRPAVPTEELARATGFDSLAALR
ncbi:hypothetical protein, partial [Falsiroseomonas oryzae]|uniref:hypothetical protein n=1 Tax=Falsiroseomonas oryzae TaxID=2766473 RepID=UPI0038CC17F8